jgi:uncharacterized protein (DUF1684 family)
MTHLQDFRKMKDEFFAHDSQSPLTSEQKKAFKGLNYFPPNPALDLEVVVQEFPEKQQIEMQTTTGDIQLYQRFGKFSFTIDGQPAELTIYHSESGWFLPFVDGLASAAEQAALASEQTYPAGRYLEPELLANGHFQVDFNLAYNPYCAYNDYWSCPLTPFENRIKVPIRAGEKLFHN